ncbi:heterokaryon incompatibility protein-domain-containing protein [Hypoxylon trugodes]|uniref:heterokaryon incompatibility protein-domain-containing protein n=1 Tax=Hypoxylon trugodes TaxID=326681 RepID=UPI0021987E50|nr:heterokaryon incompatibility protein-domain-containing protein [Hypoxylon trugodes]KAI1391819.1 heterokaryon incompatibility protein-domain-containing protein [Hypoxylon trugodes]
MFARVDVDNSLGVADWADLNSCRLCDVCERIILAVVDGCLPTAFRGARDETERTRILNELEAGPWWNPGKDDGQVLILRIMDQELVIELFRDAEEQPEFSVQGVKFDKMTLYEPGTNSDRAFKTAKGWLRECLEQHRCGGLGSTPYPKRLLDLREGIARDDLPKTFQDAVAICQRMSINYLWIDSLCILQEFGGMSDEETQKTKADFVEGNSAMATIYRNSHFTIFASISTSMSSGIFSTEKNITHRINVIDDNGNKAILCIRKPNTHSNPPTDMERRGWTYQEYLLPPRVLDFRSFDISWRCKERHTCECGSIPAKLDWHARLAEQGRTPHSATEAEKWWPEVVKHYTARSLTHEQDKLPALSGLAQIYHEATGDTYLAGLWKASLPGSLLWPRAFRAPSWSWASLDSLGNAESSSFQPGVAFVSMWPPLVRRTVCTIHNVDCQLKTDDVFGEVLDGSITLGAICIAAKIGRKPQGGDAWTLSYVEDGTDVLACLPDCKLEDDGLSLGDTVYCVPILEKLSGWDSHRNCLVLKQLPGGQYQRVGFCILRKRNRTPTRYRSRMRFWLGPIAKERIENIQNFALQYNPDAETRITII